jgi:thiol-disulfide isomerase/thioredoxin
MKQISRRTITYSIAALAAASGASVALWRHQLAEPQDDALAALWALQLETVDGQLFSMSSLRGKPLVLNFWATWCPPCIDELPLLEQFYLKNNAKSWQMIAIAVDNAKAVKQFLAKMPLSFPAPLAGLGGTELSRSLGNVSGGLPFTVVINGAGDVALRHMGKLSAEQISDFVLLK